MNVDPISATFGGALILLGLVMRFAHRAAWQRELQEFIDDPRELRHHQARYRRRRQTSGLIALVGLLIAVADLPIVWRQAGPLISTVIWISVFALCGWIGLLAVGDFATTRAHSQANLAKLQAQKEVLMGKLEAMRPRTSPPAEQNPPEAN